MKLTVLGNHGTYPGRNGACSSYLIEDEGTRILIDCGNGCLGKLQNFCEVEDIDAIIISHLHFDHIADLFPLKYALETKAYRGKKISPKKLFIPKMTEWMKADLCDNGVFEIVNIDENSVEFFRDLKITFATMQHLIESYAVIIEKGGIKYVYSGDTGINEKLKEISQKANLLLCEATFLDCEGEGVTHHMTAKQAALVAKESEVKKLLLTHLWSETEKNEYVKEAKEFFSNVEIGEELSTYEIY